MSEKMKIALLGRKGTTKKYLQYFILGIKDPKEEKSLHFTRKTKQTNQNDKFEILEINIEGNQEKERKEIKDKMLKFEPHMSLVLIDEDDIVEIQKLVQQLEEITGRDDFLVVLPLRMKSDPTPKYPFTGCSLSELFKKLSEVYHPTVPTTNRLESKRQNDEDVSDMQEMEDGSIAKRPPSGNNITETERGDHDRIKIVLLGQQGSGKSACGNTILGKKQVFRSKPSSMPVTRNLQVERGIICDIFDVTVIDTPDFFHENMESPENHKKECRELCQSGSCVYLLVMQVSRFTDGERDILNKLAQAVDPKIEEKTIILFTCGEDLRDADDKTDMGTLDIVKRTFPALASIIGQCANRIHVFENRNPDRQQVETLMQIVQTLIKGTEQGKDQGEDQDMTHV